MSCCPHGLWQQRRKKNAILRSIFDVELTIVYQLVVEGEGKDSINEVTRSSSQLCWFEEHKVSSVDQILH